MIDMQRCFRTFVLAVLLIGGLGACQHGGDAGGDGARWNEAAWDEAVWN